MQKIEVQIEVKEVFKCSKPESIYLSDDQTNPTTNTQDPTLTIVTTIQTINALCAAGPAMR